MITKILNVTKSYGSGSARAEALKGVSLDINAGDYIAIVGPSGSGKTTLLSIIGCLIHPTEGEVYFDKRRVSDISDIELSVLRGREIGFVFQFTDLLSNLTVLENVLVPILFHDGMVDEKKKYAVQLLEKLGLGYCINARVQALSGGERQRVAIARSLINRPRLLLADEPTGDLDDETSRRIISLFAAVNASGTTIVFVTHNKNFAKAATNVYEMGDGRIQRILK
ncbi:MAG TPA: ABC transporter ATP-binding protein [Spirochaetota bacterium]|nr:ABC transporter ATP-binding protein [Spirochaetota bacterium]HPH04214.1 ABC transporter ATP-binding protein [Spirochaetota bacterium]HPN83253.1 ABC transporter ATP-binding protein [Spirochaetota bacterium]